MGIQLDTLELSGRQEMLSFMYHPEHLVWYRMEAFTSLAPSSGVIEYTRRFSGSDTDVTDVIGRTVSIAYAFDYYKGNPVLEHLRKIHVSGAAGADAVVKICTVQVSDFCGTNTWRKGTVQQFCVIPSVHGDSTDCLSFSGTFQTNGKEKTVMVCPDSQWQTVHVIE